MNPAAHAEAGESSQPLQARHPDQANDPARHRNRTAAHHPEVETNDAPLVRRLISHKRAIKGTLTRWLDHSPTGLSVDLKAHPFPMGTKLGGEAVHGNHESHRSQHRRW